jgi:serine/threonine protein kinase
MIELVTVKDDDVRQPHHPLRREKCILLMKNQRLLTLIPEAGTISKWLETLRPYLLQTSIEEKYTIVEKLGEGTYGKVCLAEVNSEDATHQSSLMPQREQQPNEGLSKAMSEEERKFNDIVDQ